MDRTILTSNEVTVRIFPHGGKAIQAPYHNACVSTITSDDRGDTYCGNLNDFVCCARDVAQHQWVDAVIHNHHKTATQPTIVSIPIHLDGVWVEYDSGVHLIDGDVFVIPAGKTVHFLSIEEITVSANAYGTVFPYVIIHPHEYPLFLSPIQVVPVYIRPNSTQKIHVYVTNTTTKPREIYLYRPVAYVKFDRIIRS